METTRKAALAKGDTYYDTGKPCKHGHYSKRYTSSYGCVECDLARWNQLSKAEKDRNRSNHAVSAKKWRLANLERHREYQRQYQAAYRAKQREKQREKKLREKKQKEYQRQYQKAYRAKQRARKLAASE